MIINKIIKGVTPAVNATAVEFDTYSEYMSYIVENNLVYENSKS